MEKYEVQKAKPKKFFEATEGGGDISRLRLRTKLYSEGNIDPTEEIQRKVEEKRQAILNVVLYKPKLFSLISKKKRTVPSFLRESVSSKQWTIIQKRTRRTNRPVSLRTRRNESQNYGPCTSDRAARDTHGAPEVTQSPHIQTDLKLCFALIFL